MLSRYDVSEHIMRNTHEKVLSRIRCGRAERSSAPESGHMGYRCINLSLLCINKAQRDTPPRDDHLTEVKRGGQNRPRKAALQTLYSVTAPVRAYQVRRLKRKRSMNVPRRDKLSLPAHPFGNRVYRRLQVGCDMERNERRIRHAQVGGAVDD